MDGRPRDDATSGARKLRSARWFEDDGVHGLVHRSSLRTDGFRRIAVAGRPVVGICNSWSETVHCNLHLRSLAQAVRRGVLAAGGVPLEFPTISLSEILMKPSTMLYRNLMAMDVEESIHAQPFDAVVLLASCDKTTPAQLMGAVSANVPAIMLTGGPSLPGMLDGREIGTGSELWRAGADYRAGRITREQFDALEDALFPTAGHCSEMGTASTMAILVEALGLSLPGSATTPAPGRERMVLAEATGRRAVELALGGPPLAELVSAEAIDNAITTLMAIGGSTNAVVHLIALARRAGVPLTLERFDALARTTPTIVNVRPSGEHLVKQLHEAGGVPALLAELLPLLHGDVPTVTGRTLAQNVAGASSSDRGVLAALAEPFAPDGGIAVVEGSLAPLGALVKVGAASPELLRHRGPALVFENVEDLDRRIADPDLPVTPETVLVLRNAGPQGAPGFPEWGMLPIPPKLLRQGVTDMVRISDARMSGTSYGTIVLHTAPEAAVGGPLAAVRDGDPIVLDVAARRLDLDVPAEEIARRLAERPSGPARPARGYLALYLDHVQQAPDGCDFDFLAGPVEADRPAVPVGVRGRAED